MKFKNEKILVIIPARGGSKRIKHKNIVNLNGQPMIYWPLQEISSLFSSKQVLVSTDDKEIANVVTKKGLKVPFKRPKNLSDDFCSSLDVCLHALNWYERHINRVEYVLIIYPTAVLIKKEHLENAFKILIDDQDCDFIFSGTRFAFPIQRAVFKNKRNYIEMFNPDAYHQRSQDLREAFHDAGQFYWYKRKSLLNLKNPTNANAKLYELSPENVVDIDTIEDLNLATKYLRMDEYYSVRDDWYFV